MFMYTMPKHELALWLTALRSGEYTQTQSLLRDKDGFCCLGVYCDAVGTRYGRWENIPIDTEHHSAVNPDPVIVSPHTFAYRSNGKYHTIVPPPFLYGKKLQDYVGDMGFTLPNISNLHTHDAVEAIVRRRHRAQDGPIEQKRLSLATLNDTYGADFHLIADVIEDLVEGV